MKNVLAILTLSQVVCAASTVSAQQSPLHPAAIGAVASRPDASATRPLDAGSPNPPDADPSAPLAPGPSVVPTDTPHRKGGEPYRHDGLYGAASYGLGSYWSWSGASNQTRLISGFTPMELTLAGGVTVGSTAVGLRAAFGAVTALSADDPSTTSTALDDPSGLTFWLGSYGIFARHYFQPNDGWHVGTGASIGFLTTSRDDENATGAVLFADGGYDFWLSEQSSGGPFLQVQTHFLRARENVGLATAELFVFVPVVGLAIRAH